MMKRTGSKSHRGGPNGGQAHGPRRQASRAQSQLDVGLNLYRLYRKNLSLNDQGVQTEEWLLDPLLAEAEVRKNKLFNEVVRRQEQQRVQQATNQTILQVLNEILSLHETFEAASFLGYLRSNPMKLGELHQEYQ